MRLTLDNLVAVKSSGLMPAFAYALIAAVLLAGGSGAWAGWKLRGASAVAAENVRLRADAAALQQAAQALRQRAVDSAARHDAAAARMSAIANQWETDRETNRLYFEGQRQALARLLDDRPDLRTGRAGADVLRHWRAANAGPAAGGPVAPAPGEPDAAVPEPAAAVRRPLGNADRQPRRRRGALPRLPGAAASAERRGARVAADGLGLVLRRGEAGRHRGGRLWP